MPRCNLKQPDVAPVGLGCYEVRNASAYKFNATGTSYEFSDPDFLKGATIWRSDDVLMLFARARRQGFESGGVQFASEASRKFFCVPRFLFTGGTTGN